MWGILLQILLCISKMKVKTWDFFGAIDSMEYAFLECGNYLLLFSVTIYYIFALFVGKSDLFDKIITFTAITVESIVVVLLLAIKGNHQTIKLLIAVILGHFSFYHFFKNITIDLQPFSCNMTLH